MWMQAYEASPFCLQTREVLTELEIPHIYRCAVNVRGHTCLCPYSALLVGPYHIAICQLRFVAIHVCCCICRSVARKSPKRPAFEAKWGVFQVLTISGKYLLHRRLRAPVYAACPLFLFLHPSSCVFCSSRYRTLRTPTRCRRGSRHPRCDSPGTLTVWVLRGRAEGCLCQYLFPAAVSADQQVPEQHLWRLRVASHSCDRR
jgi:hypothetical protein